MPTQSKLCNGTEKTPEVPKAKPALAHTKKRVKTVRSTKAGKDRSKKAIPVEVDSEKVATVTYDIDELFQAAKL